MARKNESILVILMDLPWWVSVVFSAAIYVVLGLILPSMEFDSPVYQGLVNGLAGPAKLFALLFLIPVPLALLNSRRKRQLLERQKSIRAIRATDWREFEEMIAEAYRRQGYTAIENTGTGPDGGIDIRLKKNGHLYLVQCKHWKSQKVGVKVVRELYGLVTAENAAGGMIPCTGMFTQEAQNFAAGTTIDLIDGPQVEALVANVRDRPSSSQTPKTMPANACPRCGSSLVKRTAKKGRSAGSLFLGCSSFPQCRHTQSINATQ